MKRIYMLKDERADKFADQYKLFEDPRDLLTVCRQRGWNKNSELLPGWGATPPTTTALMQANIGQCFTYGCGKFWLSIFVLEMKEK